MARGASGARRIVLNRAAFDAITLATADGLFELAKTIVNDADVPDAAPLGLGLIQGGGALAYVGSKRVGIFSKYGATSVKKPRAARLNKGVTVIGGYGFPGRFLEEGTVKMHAEPFLTPEVMSTLPEAEAFVRAACIKAKVIGQQRAAKGDTYAAGKARAAAKAAGPGPL
jgi:hypothetical protein